MTFSPHKGMDLAKICISKMVYCITSLESILVLNVLHTCFLNGESVPVYRDILKQL